MVLFQECTLDKMRSLDTWLFDLNKFAYFDNGANKSPLMNCQKVVAKDRKYYYIGITYWVYKIISFL